MADPQALVRLLTELIGSLRRSGFAIATSQTLTMAGALQLLGWGRREDLREAFACIVVQRRMDRPRFDACLDAFFAARRESSTLWGRLADAGFLPNELEVLRAVLAELAQSGAAPYLGELLERGPALDRLFRLAGIARTIDSAVSPLQVGFFSHKVLSALGMPRARQSLGTLETHLRETLGERAGALTAALAAELERTGHEVRTHVANGVSRRLETRELREQARTLDTTPFTSLDLSEVEDVARAVRRFAERLRGGERVRRRKSRQGRMDPARTLRRALATGGVPFLRVRRARSRSRPRLLVLCDVSESVRSASRFLLELTYAAQDLFEGTRSFVFVSEIGEVTALFERESPSVALGQAFGGGVVSIASNSNYGSVFRAFRDRHLMDVTRRTTVVILGDGRSNYHDDGAQVLEQLRARARAVYFLCAEPRARWATGDSAMARYEPHCTRVLPVMTLSDLEDAARLLLSRRGP